MVAGVCDDPDYFYNFIDGLYRGLGWPDAAGARGTLAAVQARGLGYAISSDAELATVQVGLGITVQGVGCRVGPPGVAQGAGGRIAGAPPLRAARAAVRGRMGRHLGSRGRSTDGGPADATVRPTC
jgi:hypothetical protein